MKNMLSEALCEIRGLLNQLLTVLEGENGEEWLKEFKKFLRKEMCWENVVKNKFLKLISGDEQIVLDAVDGEVILAESDLFVCIGSGFENRDVDEKGSATEKTPVSVYEMIEDGTFTKMFGELNSDLGKMCFTQAQIENFVLKHRRWLQANGRGTFFLFKSHGHFFIAYVIFHFRDTLVMRLLRLGNGSVWLAKERHRLVVPKLA